uniref:Protein kinase domain-containing protein n=1 Tax=Panagrolaimus superbus TaxID=310955 RepID=A0A914YPW8_9BILA
MAIKIGNTFNKNEFEQIFREVEAATKIGWHRHICCLLGWSVFQSMPILMFELIEGKDLLSWAQSFQSDSNSDSEGIIMMPEKSITQILWQISDGMEHLSSLGILHKDLAARNILLSNRLEAKITDFGLASLCNELFMYEATIQRRLPLRWMAPEALRNRIFSEASDVWSFAILGWEVFSKGEIPYGIIDGNDILEFISTGNRLKIPDEISDDWKKLLNDCWNERKEERPNFKEIKIQIGLFLETQTITYGYLSCELNEQIE